MKVLKLRFIVFLVMSYFLLGIAGVKVNAAVQHNGNVNQNQVISWFENHKGKLTYSMYGSRNGLDGTADCSGSITQAVYEAGGKQYKWLYSTDYLHQYLAENNYHLVAQNYDWVARKGDIVIWGKQGLSGGAFGHVGVISSDDPNANFLSASYYTAGQLGTAVQDINYDYFAKLDNFPYTYVYRYDKAVNINQSNKKYSTVHFNQTFELNRYAYWNGYWDVINNMLSIPIVDYNNYIPLSSIVMTDSHGNMLSNQYAQIGTLQREYFRLPDHYKVLSNNGVVMLIEIAGEPVWIQAKYATIDE